MPGLQATEVTHLQPLWLSSHGFTPHPQSCLEATPMQLHFPSPGPSSPRKSALGDMQVSLSCQSPVMQIGLCVPDKIFLTFFQFLTQVSCPRWVGQSASGCLCLSRKEESPPSIPMSSNKMAGAPRCPSTDPNRKSESRDLSLTFQGRGRGRRISTLSAQQALQQGEHLSPPGLPQKVGHLAIHTSATKGHK